MSDESHPGDTRIDLGDRARKLDAPAPKRGAQYALWEEQSNSGVSVSEIRRIRSDPAIRQVKTELDQDLDEAQRSFSENRLKELADEYADNYPRLSIVLTRFYGLGTSVASKTSLRSYSLIRKYRTHVRLGSTTLPRQIDSFSCYTT